MHWLALLFLSTGPWAGSADIDEPRLDAWRESRSQSFIFISDTGDVATAELADHLETFRAVMKGITDAGNFESHTPTRIYMFSNWRTFQQVTGARDGAAGYFLSTPSGNHLVIPDNRRSTLFLLHEYAHFLQHNLKRVPPPVWYDEGFADFVATLNNRDPILVGLANPERFPRSRGDELMDLRRVLSLKSYAEPEDPQSVSNFYRTAWIFVHFLHMKHRREIPEFVGLQGRGVPVDEATARVFAMGFDEVESDLHAYWRRFLATGKFLGLRLPAAEYRVMADLEIRALAPDEAAVSLGQLAIASNGPEPAQQLFEAALAANAQSAPAHAGLAATCALSEDWDAAERHAQRAIELNPEDAVGHLARGGMASHSPRRGFTFGRGSASKRGSSPGSSSTPATQRGRPIRPRPCSRGSTRWRRTRDDQDPTSRRSH